ncbi:MAG TPA: Gfo/Idh/MocA family oxidoreductase [Xanthobacteraceae bacterium]|nr:Gfo/Idh/MocA family oxidoreductase [Xanthobacteraceae bacterium]
MAAVRLALVGAGRWGRNYIRTIASLDGVELVAVASRNAETAGLAPPGCRIVAGWRDLTDATDVEGVIVASPPDTHAEILIAALEREKAVLVEKPVVMSRRDAARIRTALDARPAIILVDHTHLFHPAFRALRREAASLGPVRAITSSAGNHGPYRRDASVLWDWAPHDLAMCLALVSGAARVERARRAEVRVIDGVAAERLVLDLTVGSTPANVTVSTLDARHRWFAAQFDSCTLVFRDFVDDKLVRFAPGADIATSVGTAIAAGSELPLSRAVIEFAERIRAKNTDRGSIDLGLSVVGLIADAEAMLETGGRQLAE